MELVNENGNTVPETKTIPTENGNITEDKDVVVETGIGSIEVYDQWVAPPVSGSRPKARYEVCLSLFFQNMYDFFSFPFLNKILSNFAAWSSSY